MEEKKMKYLFLDDIRMPSHVGNYMLPIELCPMYREENWEIVRSYDEFVAWILKNGLPDVISFDHDLAAIHYEQHTWQESFEYLEKTGYDCAKWLVNFCAHECISLPKYYIHSMNPVGAENIKNLLNNFKDCSIDEKMSTVHTISWLKAKRMIKRIKR